jgi:hypothetical protein
MHGTYQIEAMNQYAFNQHQDWKKRNAASKAQGYHLAIKLTSNGIADSREPARTFVTESDRAKFLEVSPQWVALL